MKYYKLKEHYKRKMLNHMTLYNVKSCIDLKIYITSLYMFFSTIFRSVVLLFFVCFALFHETGCDYVIQASLESTK